jgi:hypothetical protein
MHFAIVTYFAGNAFDCPSNPTLTKLDQRNVVHCLSKWLAGHVRPFFDATSCHHRSIYEYKPVRSAAARHRETMVRPPSQPGLAHEHVTYDAAKSPTRLWHLECWRRFHPDESMLYTRLSLSLLAWGQMHSFSAASTRALHDRANTRASALSTFYLYNGSAFRHKGG